MTFDYWKKTGQMKPFMSVEEFDKFAEDIVTDLVRPIRTNASKGRAIARKGFGEGAKYDSFAEYTFYMYMTKIEMATVERNEKREFLYYFDQQNKQRKYYPDFIVNGTFAEVKGILREKDQLKKQQHPEVKWYFSEDIKEMTKELDEKVPKWRDGFTQTNITKY